MTCGARLMYPCVTLSLTESPPGAVNFAVKVAVTSRKVTSKNVDPCSAFLVCAENGFPNEICEGNYSVEPFP